jgi:hypothetical protein
MVKVWSHEEVRELQSGYWAVLLRGDIGLVGGVRGYLRFTSQEERDEWVFDHVDRLSFPATSLPLSLLLDRQAWSEKVVNLSAKRKAKVLFANH